MAQADDHILRPSLTRIHIFLQIFLNFTLQVGSILCRELQCRLIFTIVLLMSFVMPVQAGTSKTGVAPASASQAPTVPNGIHPFRKRSFKRALRRESHFDAPVKTRVELLYIGGEQYVFPILRSKCLLTRQAPPELVKVQVSTDKTSTSRAGRACGYLRIMTWNSGGMQMTGLDEYMLRIEALPTRQQPHILLIEESHWTMDSEWTSGGWQCISSGCSPQNRYGGLLTLIRIRGVSAQHIRIHRVSAGRLDHIRISFQQYAIDVLHLCQKAVSFSQSQEASQKRMQLWRLLAKLLQAAQTQSTDTRR